MKSLASPSSRVLGKRGGVSLIPIGLSFSFVAINICALSLGLGCSSDIADNRLSRMQPFPVQRVGEDGALSSIFRKEVLCTRTLIQELCSFHIFAYNCRIETRDPLIRLVTAHNAKTFSLADGKTPHDMRVRGRGCIRCYSPICQTVDLKTYYIVTITSAIYSKCHKSIDKVAQAQGTVELLPNLGHKSHHFARFQSRHLIVYINRLSRRSLSLFIMSAHIPAPSLYTSPSEATLKLHYVGKSLKDCQAPAAVLDIAAIRRNCTAMLDCVDALGVKFRAHVKTHKVRIS